MKVPQKNSKGLEESNKNPPWNGAECFFLFFFLVGLCFFVSCQPFCFFCWKKFSEVRDMKTGGLDLLVRQLMAVDLFVEPPGVVSWVLISMPGITRPSYDDAMFCFLACLPRARDTENLREFGRDFHHGHLRPPAF